MSFRVARSFLFKGGNYPRYLSAELLAMLDPYTYTWVLGPA